MKCKKCGKELMSNAKFCMYCGTKVGNVCPKCGTELPDEASFCFNCGAQLKVVQPKKPQAPTRQVLGNNDMNKLSNIKKEVKRDDGYYKGAPVMDKLPNGSTCDCAIGECDCDGSYWR